MDQEFDSTQWRPIGDLSDREIAEETLRRMRDIDKLVNGFFSDLQSGKINPMQMMMGMFKK